MNVKRITEVIDLHNKWLTGAADGVRADFENADLIEKDLGNANLERSNLQGAKLTRANLTKCNLKNAYLRGANFSLADLKGANLTGADLGESILQGANLYNANLEEADLRNSQLVGANFFQSSLCRANLESANLEQASFFGAAVEGTVFTSKKDLANLGNHLTPSQLQEAIFLDEVIQEENKVSIESDARMTLTIRGGDISPYNVSLLLATINAAYNNMFFLTNYDGNQADVEFSEEEDLATAEQLELGYIRRSMSPFYQGVGASDDIYITAVRTGSQIFEIATSLSENYPILKHVAAAVAFSASSYTWYSMERKRRAETRKIESETRGQEIENHRKMLSLFDEELERDRRLINHVDSVRQSPDFQKYTESIPAKNPLVQKNIQDLSALAFQPLIVVAKKLSAYNYEIEIKLSDKEKSE